MAREEKLMVRINGDVKEDFKKEADERGITMSALAAFVLGEWVRQQKQVKSLVYAQIEQQAREIAGFLRVNEDG